MKRMFERRVIWVFVLGLFLFGAGNVAAETKGALKFGFVDINRVAEDSLTGQTMMESFQKEGMKRQIEIDEWKKKVEKMESELLKQGLLLSDTARKKKEEELRKEKRDLERFFKDSTEEFERKKVESEQELFDRIMKMVTEIGKAEGYSVILSKQFLLFGSEDVDLTNIVRKKIDEHIAK